MSKVLKKQPYLLKFDTSPPNLECFIRKKEKQKSQEIEANEKRNQESVNFTKMLKYKKQQFHESLFLENILSKVLNEEFGNPQQIRQLIENKERCRNGPNEQYKGNQVRQDIDPLQTQLLNIHVLRSRSDLSYLSIIESCERELFRSRIQDNKKEDKMQENTMNQSDSFSCETLRKQPIFEETDSFTTFLDSRYRQPYYHQNLPNYHNQLPLKKKKTTSNDDASEYKIKLEKIDQDGRTTLMIRHIPNKYSEESLLDEINKNHKLKFNFLYLPMDFYNSCNVGYAFVNFIDTKFIHNFFKEFNGKRWNKFNSEKICELAYARIQGTTSLMNHFQNNHMQVRFSSREEQETPSVNNKKPNQINNQIDKTQTI